MCCPWQPSWRTDGVAWHPPRQQLHSRRVYPPDKNERPRVFSEVCACVRARARFSWGFIHVSHYLLALVVSGLHCSTLCVCTHVYLCVYFVVCTYWKFKMSGWAEIKQVANSCCAQQIQIWGCCQVVSPSFVDLSNNYCDVYLFLCCCLVAWVLIFSTNHLEGQKQVRFVIAKTLYLRGFFFSIYVIQCALNAKKGDK